MDNIRDASSEKHIIRTHLMVRQDISNLHNIHKHTNDSTSTAMWVAELRETENGYNAILAFKPQGEFVEEIDDIPKECFLPCIQSEFQRDMMKQFGNDVICIDETHSSNIFNFLLITVMVIDSYGEGVPVALAISSKEDSCTLTQFFKPHKFI
uniref:ZSWIM1/3 RNaseH-like domain-containing protein n=1 Tax=Amphimedon queenslandica TaxID=400682 RepID=A0A1X7VQF6_AMPQE